MSYELTFEKRASFIHAIVAGDNSAETVIAYMNDVKQECEDRDCYRVLIEEKLEGKRMDEMQIFSLISEGSPDALGFFEALAYVDEQQDFEVIKFAETVAINRGIPIAVFSSVADAENWLRHRSVDAPGQDISTGEGRGEEV